MDNSDIAMEEKHDLQRLIERIDRLERIFSEFQKEKEGVPPAGAKAEDVVRRQPSSDELETIRHLTQAIDAYRVALRTGARFAKFAEPSTQSNSRESVDMASLTRDRVIEQEIRELRFELTQLRRRHSYLKYFFRVQRFAKGILRMFYPKLGKLFHHEPVPMSLWGLPPEISVPASSAGAFPVISIVTPSYRQGNFIGRTLESVVNQNYPKLEYFVQDGGSDDATASVVKSFEAKLIGWRSEPDSGQSEAINRGFAQTTGEIMAWLNSDDLLLPGTLAYVANFFATHPEVDVVYGHRILIDEQDREIARWILPKHDDEVLSWADFVPQETLFWRRSIWNKVGGRIDESFRFAMDWDLLIRFRDAGARMVRLPFFMGAFRIHETQKTSANINSVGMQEMGRLRERCHGRMPSHIDIRKAIALYLLRHMIEDFQMRLKRVLGLL